MRPLVVVRPVWRLQFRVHDAHDQPIRHHANDRGRNRNDPLAGIARFRQPLESKPRKRAGRDERNPSVPARVDGVATRDYYEANQPDTFRNLVGHAVGLLTPPSPHSLASDGRPLGSRKACGPRMSALRRAQFGERDRSLVPRVWNRREDGRLPGSLLNDLKGQHVRVAGACSCAGRHVKDCPPDQIRKQ